jgi:hypothetical protein
MMEWNGVSFESRPCIENRTACDHTGSVAHGRASCSQSPDGSQRQELVPAQAPTQRQRRLAQGVQSDAIGEWNMPSFLPQKILEHENSSDHASYAATWSCSSHAGRMP